MSPEFISIDLLTFLFLHQVMFLQNKGHVTMTIELLDTEEAQADDPLDVQVNTCLQTLVYKHLFL